VKTKERNDLDAEKVVKLITRETTNLKMMKFALPILQEED